MWKNVAPCHKLRGFYGLQMPRIPHASLNCYLAVKCMICDMTLGDEPAHGRMYKRRQIHITETGNQTKCDFDDLP